ncbi:MAG: rhodanese-like domain-containing protein [Gammaproteobacteria bacterium]|nr:rhodanese-like domain-containing protein [Gammaproteobacteria bacterium]
MMNPTPMRRAAHGLFTRVLACLLAGVIYSVSGLAASPAATIPAASLVQPAQLASMLKDVSLPRPLILQVGFRTLYEQAHVPGAEYAGPANTAAGLQALRGRVNQLPRNAAIIIYCGCCPWSRCPNIAAAYNALHELGFGNLKVMYVAENFGADWVEKGYPTETGP